MGIAAGGAGNQKAGLITSMGGPMAFDRVTMGREIVLTPAEVAALPAELRDSLR